MIRRFRPILFGSFALFFSLCMSACSNQQADAAPDATKILESLPAADAAKYGQVQDMKNWRNPYLIVRADSVTILDSVDSAEITVKTDDLLASLSRLPASYWPYGRVVAAVQNSGHLSDQEAVAIRRNRGIVGGTLKSAGIVVKWIEP